MSIKVNALWKNSATVLGFKLSIADALFGFLWVAGNQFLPEICLPLLRNAKQPPHHVQMTKFSSPF